MDMWTQPEAHTLLLTHSAGFLLILRCVKLKQKLGETRLVWL